MRGETDHRLAPREFYELLGRPDLASRYQSRRNTGTALMVAGGGAVVLGLGYSIYVAATQDDCELGPDFGTCFDENGKRFTRAVTIALVGGAVGIGVAGIGYYYRARAHPVSENEAKQLADQYNEGLRHDLGLPTLTSTLRPRIRDVQWAPVVDPSTGSGGLSLTGRF